MTHYTLTNIIILLKNQTNVQSLHDVLQNPFHNLPMSFTKIIRIPLTKLTICKVRLHTHDNIHQAA